MSEEPAEYIDKLMPCPFCGGEPKFKRIGNDYTKRRSIRIKCKKCRATKVNAALTHSFDWLEEVCAEDWNQRPENN